ncbi:hypothetical protein TREMEDRAFT_59764 [Tremella mesenterica DSM 1558]|uniref:uncharacterized protein n=1 Tax=Tremella mesenterica (strain ATCC 24925 / CBS 8224 / DSM 1558 / NBRC 9311 / NRRL Y-6157 / RJB 2259-6 / UBC 559-6) TaxID=578456 RepID=UPI0003F48D10|nr:uncharacterized protein TREMEDRAFT_59764 [Tremella mesenterica DSM 1558]EIW73590.1 hypothetical protein TREMEDRAFT_59764 [Tremella mesenterica DSM 1558]
MSGNTSSWLADTLTNPQDPSSFCSRSRDPNSMMETVLRLHFKFKIEEIEKTLRDHLPQCQENSQCKIDKILTRDLEAAKEEYVDAMEAVSMAQRFEEQIEYLREEMRSFKNNYKTTSSLKTIKTQWESLKSHKESQWEIFDGKRRTLLEEEWDRAARNVWGENKGDGTFSDKVAEYLGVFTDEGPSSLEFNEEDHEFVTEVHGLVEKILGKAVRDSFRYPGAITERVGSRIQVLVDGLDPEIDGNDEDEPPLPETDQEEREEEKNKIQSLKFANSRVTYDVLSAALNTFLLDDLTRWRLSVTKELTLWDGGDWNTPTEPTTAQLHDLDADVNERKQEGLHMKDVAAEIQAKAAAESQPRKGTIVQTTSESLEKEVERIRSQPFGSELYQAVLNDEKQARIDATEVCRQLCQEFSRIVKTVVTLVRDLKKLASNVSYLKVEVPDSAESVMLEAIWQIIGASLTEEYHMRQELRSNWLQQYISGFTGGLDLDGSSKNPSGNMLSTGEEEPLVV